MPADEFEIIRTLFAPLAKSAGARGLADDAAVLQAEGRLVATTDAVVEGVHFFAADPLDMVAKKALRVNVSDLTAKGAKSQGALLTLVWPDARPSAEIADFVRGLAEDLAFYDIALMGGDTAATPGPLTVSITAFGAPLGPRVPSRADAKPGEDVWVTGALGDAWLGHEALTGAWDAGAHVEAVIERYRLPDPPVAFAPVVARHAGAAMDVSDGLAGDATKLAKASGVALRIEAAALPLSPAGRAWRAAHAGYGRLFDWGDDYQILFTAAPEARAAIEADAAATGVQVSRIGVVEAGEGVRITAADGGELKLGGHVHMLGR